MSLSVTALLAAAVKDDPQAIVAIDGGPGLTVGELDRRSRVAAGALLAAGGSPEAAISLPPTAGLDRAVRVLAAWRVGLVVNLDQAMPPCEWRAAAPTPEAENRLRVAESRVWSETPAVITSAKATLTHGDLIDELGNPAHPAELLRRLMSGQYLKRTVAQGTGQRDTYVVAGVPQRIRLREGGLKLSPALLNACERRLGRHAW